MEPSGQLLLSQVSVQAIDYFLHLHYPLRARVLVIHVLLTMLVALSPMHTCSVQHQRALLLGADSVPWLLAGSSHDGSGFRAYVQSANNKRKASEAGIRGDEPAAKLANHLMPTSGALAGIQKVSMAAL